MKYEKKFLLIVCIMSLLSSNLVYADTNTRYPDCIAYDYQTGEQTIIPSETFMPRNNTWMNASSEMVSPAYDIGVMRTIIPPDDRVKVDPNTEPYCKVLCLNLGRDTTGDGVADSWALGTGFMVYDDLMLTAGHCLLSSQLGNVTSIY